MTSDNDSFEINLDGKKVKTPNGSVLKIRNQTLAAAVANEWRAQKELIRPNSMHLTSLCNTVMDNPMNFNKQSLIGQMTEYLENDTLLFREDPDTQPDLHAIQIKEWDPVVEYFMNTHDIDMVKTSDLYVNPVPSESIEKFSKHLMSHNIETLLGLNFVTENLKSLILTTVSFNKKISIERAVSLSRLETEYQINKWGNVEWAHDLDLLNLNARVAAGLLFAILHSNGFSDNRISKSQP